MEALQLLGMGIVGLGLVMVAVYALVAQGRRCEKALRAIMEVHSEELALQAQLVALKHGRELNQSRGTVDVAKMVSRR